MRHCLRFVRNKMWSCARCIPFLDWQLTEISCWIKPAANPGKDCHPIQPVFYIPIDVHQPGLMWVIVCSFQSKTTTKKLFWAFWMQIVMIIWWQKFDCFLKPPHNRIPVPLHLCELHSSHIYVTIDHRYAIQNDMVHDL